MFEEGLKEFYDLKVIFVKDELKVLEIIFEDLDVILM